jgi:cytidylate kinase
MSLESFSRCAADSPEVDHFIDERTREEAKSGNVVIDAQLAAWIVKDRADIKLLLIASDAVRFNRIAQRDHVSFEFAKNETVAREEIQRIRYKNYYGIDVSDLSIYDLRIDTGIHSIEVTKKNTVDAVRNLLQKKETAGSA